MYMISQLPLKKLAAIGGGRYAEVFRVNSESHPAILKVARLQAVEAAGATDEAYWAAGVGLHTGGSAGCDPDPNEILDAEAKALARVQHPAFVKLLDRGVVTVDGSPRTYLLLEDVGGSSWREALRASRAGVSVADVAQLVDILSTVQRSGQLDFHGDIKPDNVLRDREGKVRIIDPSSGMLKRGAGGRVERMMATGSYNPLWEPSDIPAVGLLLMEALTGANPLLLPLRERERPLGEQLQARAGLARAVGLKENLERLTRMPLPRDLEPALSEAVEQIALRCLGLRREGTEGLEAERPFEDLGELGEALAALG